MRLTMSTESAQEVIPESARKDIQRRHSFRRTVTGLSLLSQSSTCHPRSPNLKLQATIRLSIFPEKHKHMAFVTPSSGSMAKTAEILLHVASAATQRHLDYPKLQTAQTPDSNSRPKAITGGNRPWEVVCCLLFTWLA